MSEHDDASTHEAPQTSSDPDAAPSNPRSEIRNPESDEPKSNDPEKDARRAARRAEREKQSTTEIVHFRPGQPEHRWSIKFWRSVVVLFSRLYHHLSVRTRNPLPASGAAILVCNHISGLDPVLLQAASSRLIVWMMAKEYYDMKSMKWFFKTVEAIPVARGQRDTSSTRAAIRALEAGRVLGIFPEGKIETSRDLLPFHIGVAMIALRTGVPVYPAYLDGTTRGKEMLPAVLMPNTISLRFGPKVEFDTADSSKEGLTKATQAIQAAVESLRLQENELRQEKNLSV